MKCWWKLWKLSEKPLCANYSRKVAAQTLKPSLDSLHPLLSKCLLRLTPVPSLYLSSFHWADIDTFWKMGRIRFDHLEITCCIRKVQIQMEWKQKFLAHCLKLFSVEILIQIAMEVIRVVTLWEWIQYIYHSYFPPKTWLLWNFSQKIFWPNQT